MSIPRRVLVTGASGFVGKHLCLALRRAGVEVYGYGRTNSDAELGHALAVCDVVFHFAGVNRPTHISELTTVNVGLTVEICTKLEALGRTPRVVLASSVQAARDNPYGASKREAEEVLRGYAERTGADAVVYRLSNLFGKWSRPNYNSVVATFCHNMARGLPISVSDPERELELTYIDDVVAACLGELEAGPSSGFRLAPGLLAARVSLGSLAELVRSFSTERSTLTLPNFERPFVRALYATYLSHLELERCVYDLEVRADQRGSLAELLEGPQFGQIFVSRTNPGVTRGNHYHDTKVEKFIVLHGEAQIRLRRVDGDQVVEFFVRGGDYRVVDIPPGHAHSIENVGSDELVTLFWADEVFDAARPDTFFEPVLRGPIESEPR